MARDKPKADPRYFVTLEYSPGEKDSAEFNIKVGTAKVTLKKGDNEVAIGLWHAIGGDTRVNDMIATGVIRSVCRKHKWEVVDALEIAELAAVGYRVKAGDDHPEKPHCRYCGHTKETATARVVDDAAAQKPASSK